INLARFGKSVRVFEKRGDVGKRHANSRQAIFGGAEYTKSILKRCNLADAKVQDDEFSRFRIATDKREGVFELKPPGQLIERGGKNSLEYSLCRIARKEGVQFEFNAEKQEGDADIVATGPYRADAVAYGQVFENANLPKDQITLVYSDRYSPRAWYMYAMPHGKRMVEIVNCVSDPHLKKVKELYHRGLKEVACLKEIVEGATPIYDVAGIGNAEMPKTCVHGGRLYVGEAAGFQDAAYGFGMEFALLSGRLAAEAVAQGKDYDALWKREFMDMLKLRFAKRFILASCGNWLIDRYISMKPDGSIIDNGKMHETLLRHRVLLNSLFYLEMAKKRATGYW
ncbi:MAG: hypothetical protein ABH829_00005, partial [archaeon]